MLFPLLTGQDSRHLPGRLDLGLPQLITEFGFADRCSRFLTWNPWIDPLRPGPERSRDYRLDRNRMLKRIWMQIQIHAFVSEWSKGAPEDWAIENIQIAGQAYHISGIQEVMPSGTKLSDDYCRMALPVIREQLSKVGIRLAYRLNEIFR
jgi:hypothetical protein